MPVPCEGTNILGAELMGDAVIGANVTGDEVSVTGASDETNDIGADVKGADVTGLREPAVATGAPVVGSLGTLGADGALSSVGIVATGTPVVDPVGVVGTTGAPIGASVGCLLLGLP